MPAPSAFVPSFSIASLAQAVAAPFTSLVAYTAGAIDINGNLLKPESSIDPFEYFVIKLKKIFEEVPMSYTKARLGNYSSAYQYFSENAKKFNIDETELILFIEGCLAGAQLLQEDMGTAGIAGASSPGDLAVPASYENKGQVAGYDIRLSAPLFRRTPVEMFDVTPEEFEQFKNAKAWKHIKDGDTKRYLQRFQRRNPNGKMALRTKRPDTDEHDLYWITYAPKSFMEEYNLTNLNFFLSENTDSPNIENEEHVLQLYSDMLETKSKDKSTSKKSKDHEHRTRMAAAILGIRASELDHVNVKNREGAHQNFFKTVFSKRNKLAGDPDKVDLVAYNSATGQPIDIDAKFRWEGKTRIPTLDIFGNIIGKQTAQALEKTSTVRPSLGRGQASKPNPAWQEEIGKIQDEALEAIGKEVEERSKSGTFAMGVRGKQGAPATFLPSQQGLRAIGGIIPQGRRLAGMRGLGSTKEVQAQMNPVETEGQAETLRKQAGLHSEEFPRMYVTDDDLEHMKRLMIGSKTEDKEHLKKVEQVHTQIKNELSSGGFIENDPQKQSLAVKGMHF